MSLGQTLSGYWHSIQADLFPWLEEDLGPLGERYRRFVTVLELARVESFLPHFQGLPGRPVEDRAALARAFNAKAVVNPGVKFPSFPERYWAVCRAPCRECSPDS